MLKQSALGNVTANALLNWIKGTEFPAPPTSLYVTLWIARPSTQNSAGHLTRTREINIAGKLSEPVDGISYNTEDILIRPIASGVARWLALMSSTASDANALVEGHLDKPIYLTVNEPLRIKAGALKLDFSTGAFTLDTEPVAPSPVKSTKWRLEFLAMWTTVVTVAEVRTPTGIPYTATASSENSTSFRISNINDGNINTGWTSSASDVAPWVDLTFVEPVALFELEVIGPPSGPTDNPISIRFSRWDGDTLVPIWETTAAPAEEKTTRRLPTEFPGNPIAPAKAGELYRLQFHRSYNDLGHLLLLGALPVAPMPPVMVTPSETTTGVAYALTSAITSGWGGRSHDAYIDYRYPEPVEITEIDIASPNSNYSYDLPADFSWQRWNGSSFETLWRVTNGSTVVSTTTRYPGTYNRA